jgi:signal transduction histidine kinase/ligand-binding sensor domain-containing protein
MVSRLAILLVCILISTGSVSAQESVFNRVSIQDGLLSNNILNIWQDGTGYFWIGTENGLQRYDGYRFRTIFPKRLDQILTDKKGRVWMRANKTIGLFDTASFSFTPVPIEAEDQSLDKNEIRLYVDATCNPYCIISGQSCQYYNEKEHRFSTNANPFRLPDSLRIVNVIEDTVKHRYWVTTFNGLGYWDKKVQTYYSAANNPHNDPLIGHKKVSGIVAHFFIDKSQRYWIQTWDKANMSFACFDGKTNRFTTDTAGLGDAGNGGYFDVYSFQQFTDTSIFIYGKNCLRIHENGAFRELKGHIQDPYSIRFNSVNHILQDREGILWFATDDGLYNTTRRIHQNFHAVLVPKTVSAAINAIHEDEQGRIWLGTWGRGAVVINEKLQSTTIPASLNQFNDGFTKLMWSICPEPSKRYLWIGCQEGRLLIYDTKTEEAKLYIPKAFQRGTIRQIVSDNNGALWVGLQNGKVFRCDNPSNQITDSSFRLVHQFSGHISKMRYDDKNRLMIAVNGVGVYILAPSGDRVVEKFDRSTIVSPVITSIRDMLPLNDSIYLLAGEELVFFNNKSITLTTISSYNNLPVGTVYALQKDDNNDCWISTSNGIFRFSTRTKRLTPYSQRDGLLTIHNNSYILETSIGLRDGRIAFAGNQHFLAFDAKQYQINAAPPAVIITGFQLNNNYLRMDSLQNLSRIRLPYTGNSFTIEFSTFSFLQFDKLTVEYRLEGSNEEWTELKRPEPVRYNLLPHGSYRFLVRARNSDGVVSKSVTALPIYISPPFWKATWFYILLAVTLVGFFYYLHRLRLQRALHVEKVRSRLARDLHDDMGSTLSTINILSNIALQQNPLDEKASKEYMSTINSSTSQMMESMDDIVWSINPVNDTLAKVLARMKEVAGNLLEQNNIDYRFDTDDSLKDINFSMEGRREIFLIFKEALNNILKYARCSQVNIGLKRSGKFFILRIEDNGVGFDLSARTSATRGNGLRNIKKRAESLNGNSEVQSAPGSGTCVIITVPIA